MSAHAAPAQLTLLGSPALLAARPRFAFLCSRACPAAAILPAMEALQTHRDRGDAVVSGFHSPLEREALYLRGKNPVLAVATSALENFRPPAAWAAAIATGGMPVISAFTPADRASVRNPRDTAHRNRIVLALADERLIPHAEPSGSLAELLAENELRLA